MLLHRHDVKLLRDWIDGVSCAAWREPYEIRTREEYDGRERTRWE